MTKFAYHRLQLLVPHNMWEEAEPLFDGHNVAIMSNDDTGMITFETIVPIDTDLEELQNSCKDFVSKTTDESVELVYDQLPDVNWLEYVHQQCPPITAGRFYVHGSHVEPPADQNVIPILIDSATAFGTGQHETTQGCLTAIDWLGQQEFKPKNILDVGCGSGILAIGAVKLFGAPAIATDIEPESVRVTIQNAEINRVTNHLTSFHGAGIIQKIKDQGPYDLILSNILAHPLIDMSEDISTQSAPSGYIILSGFLADNVDDVVSAFARHGCKHIKTIEQLAWRAVILQKSN